MSNTDYRLSPEGPRTPFVLAPAELRRARLRVATEATDAQDCATLLEALGIDKHGELITW